MTDEPSNTQGLDRYTYDEQFLEQDSTDANQFREFSLKKRVGYELAIGPEVLVRFLDGRFILDLHAVLCDTIGAVPEESAIASLIPTFRIPVQDEVVKLR